MLLNLDYIFIWNFLVQVSMIKQDIVVDKTLFEFAWRAVIYALVYKDVSWPTTSSSSYLAYFHILGDHRRFK